MAESKDYRIMGGPATMCDYFVETRGRVKPKKKDAPECEYKQCDHDTHCDNFFCGMCRCTDE